MYFTAKLEFDPSQATLIKKVKTTSFFSNFLDVLTFGSLTKKQEQETFTAVSILQQIFQGLKSIHIDNIIRLSVDDYDFYYDESGKEDDLEEAMLQFSTKIDPIESELFNTIYLVLEHLHDSIKYLIEIRVKRKHKVGEYPISIHINGVINDFKIRENETTDELKSRMSQIFASQDTYINFLSSNKLLFENYVDILAQNIQKYVTVDDIIKQITTQVIRPKNAITHKEQIRHDKESKPVNYGYFGFDDYFFYAWLWSAMMFSNNIFASDMYLVDEIGNEIMYIGDSGMNAGDSGLFDDTIPFAPIIGDDIHYYDDNEYSEYISEKNIDTPDIDSLDSKIDFFETSDGFGGSDDF